MTDQELVQGIVDNEQAAFKELVETHQLFVIRTCYSLVHNMEDAQDLAQEVFIEILKSAAAFRGTAKLSSWIYRIAVNKSINHIKRCRRRETLSLFSLADPGRKLLIEQCTNAEVDPGMEDMELKQALHKAIDSLPVNQKVAFTLHNYEDLPYKEIAEVMNVSLSSVESLIHRARLNLRKRLNNYYHSTRK